MVKSGPAEWWGNLVTFWVLSVSLGVLGLDRFFKGEAGWGVLKLITGGGLGIWYLVDIAVHTFRLGKTGQWTKGQV